MLAQVVRSLGKGMVRCKFGGGVEVSVASDAEVGRVISIKPKGDNSGFVEVLSGAQRGEDDVEIKGILMGKFEEFTTHRGTKGQRHILMQKGEVMERVRGRLSCAPFRNHCTYYNCRAQLVVWGSLCSTVATLEGKVVAVSGKRKERFQERGQYEVPPMPSRATARCLVAYQTSRICA